MVDPARGDGPGQLPTWTTGINQTAIRPHNRASVLQHVHRAGELDRAALSERTGLTQQAVSKIVAELLELGLLSSEKKPTAGVGKPPSLLRIRSTSRHALGAQLDRDGYTVVRTDLVGTVEEVVAGSLPLGHPPGQAVAGLTDGVRRLLDGVPPDRVLGLGVGAVGPLDHRTGRVLGATNMPGWDDVPLRDLLAASTGLTVSVDKNTNAAALAHSWPQLADGTTAVVLVGTGIGTGLLIDGRVHRGNRSGAGEFGHTTIDFEGPRCACGRRGCVEVLHRLAPTPAAAARLLGLALANLVNTLDLDRIVLLGRTIDRTPDLYRTIVTDALHGLPRSPQHPPVLVEISALGETAVALGGAAHILSTFYETPR